MPVETPESIDVPTAEVFSPQQLKNLAIGKEHKEAGDKAFRSGDEMKALQSYHTALLYFRGLNRNSPVIPKADQDAPKPKNEVDELLEKVYSNMSACHLKLQNWAKTVYTADKALALNKDNYKALFRKGKALGEQGWFEKAQAIYSELLQKNVTDAPTIAAELEALRKKEKQLEKKHNAKLRGFLSRDKTLLQSDKEESTSSPTTAIETTTSASIEEVKD